MKSLKKAQSKYANKLLIAKVSANPDTEVEIYQWLSQQPNKSGALKALIEKEIAGKEEELNHNYRVIASIKRHINRRYENFGLFFVECSSERRREDLLTSLDGTYSSSIITVDYSAFKGSQRAYLDDWLQDIIIMKKVSHDIVAINLVGFEELLLLDDKEILEAAARLDSRKNDFRRLGVPLFFWTTRQAKNKVSIHAPEFYALHNDILTVKP